MSNSSSKPPTSKSSHRIAVLGGDGRLPEKVRPHIPDGATVRHFLSARNKGDGEANRLMDALRAHGIDCVLILARWNGHSVTSNIRNLCKQLDIPVHLIH